MAVTSYLSELASFLALGAKLDYICQQPLCSGAACDLILANRVGGMLVTCCMVFPRIPYLSAAIGEQRQAVCRG